MVASSISRQDTISQATDVQVPAKIRRKKLNAAFQFKDHAHSLLAGIEGFERTCKCFKVVRKNHNATIQLNADGTASFGGLARCGSIWACPVCAPHIAAKRASMIELVLSECLARGDLVLFMTFTCWHDKKTPFAWLLPSLDKAMVWFKQHRAVKAILKRLGYVDKVTSKDATWSTVNGWHPHRHEIWVYDPSKAVSTIDKEIKELQDLWVRALEKQGLTADPAIGLQVSDRDTDQDSAARIGDYCTKIATAAGLSLELASGVTKKGKKKGHKGENHYSPFELLVLSFNGDYEAGRAWVDYQKVMKGKRQIVMGRYLSALLKRLQLDDEFYDDEKLANKEDGITDSKPLEHGAITAMRYLGKLVVCLMIAEQEGLQAAYEFSEECRWQYLDATSANAWGGMRFRFPDWFDPLLGMEDLVPLSTHVIELGSGIAWGNRVSFDEYARMGVVG